jgi:hypothetical protein
MVGKIHNVFASCKDFVDIFHHLLTNCVIAQIQKEETYIFARLDHNRRCFN